MVVKSALRDLLLNAGIDDPRQLASGPRVVGRIGGGRTPHALVRGDDGVWVLKAYLRGGLIARWNRDRYWGRERFLRELRVAVRADRSGVPTVEVLALVLEEAGLGSVRCWLLTRLQPDARPLQEFLRTGAEAPLSRAAGEAVSRMHRAGIDHPDLNVSNLVGWMDGETPRVCIIDWDGACCREAGTWSPSANLLRLWRSIVKGRQLGYFDPGWGRDGTGVFAPAVGLRAFLRGYFRGRPAELSAARVYFKRRLWLIAIRALFWRRRS